MKTLSSNPAKPAARPSLRLTDNRLRLAAIIAALIVASIAIILRVEAPAVWTFLGLVVTAILGQGRGQE